MTNQTTPEAPRGRPFPPGTSGNPKGRPPGSRNRATLLWEQMSEAAAEDLFRIGLELARSGDKTMLRMCFDRLVPRLRERLVSIELPPVKSAADRAAAIHAICTAQAAGEITIGEAEGEIRLVDRQIEAIEISYYARQADELLQSRGLGIAKLVPTGSESSARPDGAPGNHESDAPADDSAPETEPDGTLAADSAVPKTNQATDNPAPKTSADDCADERRDLKSNSSPPSNGAPVIADNLPKPDESPLDSDEISSKENPENRNPVGYDRASKGNGASAPDDGGLHKGGD